MRAAQKSQKSDVFDSQREAIQRLEVRAITRPAFLSARLEAVWWMLSAPPATMPQADAAAAENANGGTPHGANGFEEISRPWPFSEGRFEQGDLRVRMFVKLPRGWPRDSSLPLAARRSLLAALQLPTPGSLLVSVLQASSSGRAK